MPGWPPRPSRSPRRSPDPLAACCLLPAARCPLPAARNVGRNAPYGRGVVFGSLPGPTAGYLGARSCRSEVVAVERSSWGRGMRAIVVGAGVGGLAATLSLRRAGHEVTLVEQAARFTEIGAGIQLAPNATRLLRRLGLLDAVAAQAARPSHVSFRTWSDGAEICRYALGRAAEDAFGAPYLLLHRADLHQALAAAVPPSSVRLNTVVVGIDQDEESARVTTASGERLRARTWSWPPTGYGRRPAGGCSARTRRSSRRTIAYRALLPADEVADLGLPDLGLWLGPGRHFVHYWVRRGELLNVVAVFTAEAEAHAATESWTARAEPGEQLREFDGWDSRVLERPRTRRADVPLRHPYAGAARAVERRPGDPAGRQRPRDGAVPGPGRGSGDHGRGRTRRRPHGCDPGRGPRRARPVRTPAPGHRHAACRPPPRGRATTSTCRTVPRPRHGTPACRRTRTSTSSCPRRRDGRWTSLTTDVLEERAPSRG